MTLCKPWITHTSLQAKLGPLKKINKFNIDKTNTKKIELKLLQLKYHR